MRGLVVLLVLAACGNDAARPMECTDGESRECYGGPEGTVGIGPCLAGLEVCSGGRWPGICIGDIVPRAESCNDFDDDCDGQLDDAPSVGEECTGTNGCTGERACDEGGSVRCFAPAKNDCGLCAGPDIPELGDSCSSDEGCVGEYVCATDMTFAVCVTPVQNECDLCGGPAIADLGMDCMSADSCPGTMVCNAEGNASLCNAPLLNECDACFPSVGTPGASCTAARGCVGVGSCNVAGDALECALDAPCGHVVISEIATGSATCNTDEFIELYNPTARTISLAGYTLRSRSASSGNFTRLVVFPPDATIAAHGFYLVASSRADSPGCANGYTSIAGNTVTANLTYSIVDLSGTVGGIWLVTTDANPTAVTDAIVVDVVGFDNNTNAQPATLFEGTGPTPAPEAVNASGSLERKANAASTSTSLASGGADATAGNAQDTDDNLADFVSQAVRVPQNASSTAEP